MLSNYRIASKVHGLAFSNLLPVQIDFNGLNFSTCVIHACFAYYILAVVESPQR